MEPGLRPGEALLVRRLGANTSPANGSIVVFESSGVDLRHYLKRVIARPGDLLQAEEGCLFLNGERLAEPYLEGLPSMPGLEDRWETSLDADHFFVMGDNRVRSTDSRQFGPIHREAIWGQAAARVWPPSAMGSVA